jgi:hypothetical protein
MHTDWLVLLLRFKYREIERCYETSEIHNNIICDRAYPGAGRSLGRVSTMNVSWCWASASENKDAYTRT